MASFLDREQRRVAAAMAFGAALAGTILVAGWQLNPFRAPVLASAAERVTYALSLESFDVIWLALAVGDVARRRFFSPSDIGGSGLGGGESPAIRQARAVLQNTLEQCVLGFGAHLALAARLPDGGLEVLPALVALFATGRLLFWIGYGGGAARRAFGFALTFYPSVAACLLAAWLAIFAPA